ncbi:hypothetical protein [Corallococcus sicarius]|uniref:hypothetical protein n=1 Tax=Corallococcus sicarius TaxID=2316726 RepID=UPI0011C3CBA1|nr:hypothetical protein [Corallococcus sicarius]
MISISRGEEPKELIRSRRQHLSQARINKQKNSPIEFSGYEIIKKYLAEAQYFKCAFCEKGIRLEGSPVEHFRPKGGVSNPGKAPDPNRYWWLAWTWENLLLACFRCNTTYKKNQFPIKEGSAPLAEFSFALHEEHALLIDPTRTDPRHHIRFQYSTKRNKWLPVSINGSVEGDQTIHTLGLEFDESAQHHIELVEHYFLLILDSIVEGPLPHIRRTWDWVIKSLFAKKQSFHSLTWDILDHQFPEDTRTLYGLDMPTLGRLEHFDPAPVFSDPPELSLVSESLRLRVRALGPSASQDVATSLVKDLLDAHAFTNEELALLLERTVSTVKSWRRLVALP